MLYKSMMQSQICIKEVYDQWPFSPDPNNDRSLKHVKAETIYPPLVQKILHFVEYNQQPSGGCPKNGRLL